MKRESLNTSVPSPCFQSGSGLLNHTGETHSHICMMYYPRTPFTEWNFGRVRDSIECWKVNFRTEVPMWSFFALIGFPISNRASNKKIGHFFWEDFDSADTNDHYIWNNFSEFVFLLRRTQNVQRSARLPSDVGSQVTSAPSPFSTRFLSSLKSSCFAGVMAVVLCLFVHSTSSCSRSTNICADCSASGPRTVSKHCSLPSPPLHTPPLPLFRWSFRMFFVL